MSRAEVWRVGFDRSIGGEIRKTRPAVIVSNDAANKAMADQIATVSKRRLQQRVGRLSAPDMTAVERVIRVQRGI